MLIYYNYIFNLRNDDVFILASTMKHFFRSIFCSYYFDGSYLCVYVRGVVLDIICCTERAEIDCG